MRQALLFAVALMAADARAQDAELQRLFATLAARGERSVQFVERRHSALFRSPPAVRGTLRFVPPGRLEREVTGPPRERVAIDGEQVTVHTVDADGRQTVRRLSLASQPQLAALADALRAILAGDVAALARQFEVRLLVPPPRWQAQLLPHDAQLPVTRIRLAGTEARLERIEIVEGSGDRVEIELLAPRP